VSWTQAICERDWIARESYFVHNVLVSIRRPSLVHDPESPIERCCYCGLPTIWGAFVRDDPAVVPFPRQEL
jgi:hypothetical protein